MNEHTDNTDRLLQRSLTDALGPESLSDAEIERLLDEESVVAEDDEQLDRIIERARALVEQSSLRTVRQRWAGASRGGSVQCDVGCYDEAHICHHAGLTKFESSWSCSRINGRRHESAGRIVLAFRRVVAVPDCRGTASGGAAAENCVHSTAMDDGPHRAGSRYASSPHW